MPATHSAAHPSPTVSKAEPVISAGAVPLT
jgi:hypothetical protein